MKEKAILLSESMEERIQEVLKSVFTDHQGCFEDSYGPNEISGWDSMHHLALIMALNNEFGIDISFEEMLEIRVVGDIKTILKKHNIG